MSNLIKRIKIACAITASMCATLGHSEPLNLYRETFGFCTGSIGRESAAEANWVGMVAGLPQAKISSLKVFGYGVSDIGQSVNSNPIGLSQGYAFWFKPVYGLSLFTAEFPIDVGVLKATSTTLSYRQRLSGIDMVGVPNKTRLAFLIDNIWYISNESYQQIKPGNWESVMFTPGLLSYGTVPYVPGLGPNAPLGSASPLPASGVVKAFGIFMDEVNGRVRLDNFIINGELPANGSISGDIQKPDVSLCPAGSPDRTGSGGGQQQPDGDDGDSSVDQLRPEQPAPTPASTPAPIESHAFQYQFCPIKEQGTGRIVTFSTKSRNAVIKNVPADTVENLRDRAIVSILAQRSMPLGAMVNIKRGDYADATGVLSLSVRAKSRPIKLRLRGSARQATKAYLASAGAPKDITAPLFVQGDLSVLHVSIKKAMCLADARAMLRLRARAAKVKIGGINAPTTATYRG